MRFLAAIGVLAIVAVVGAAIFFLGGFYNVGGTAAEPTIVKWVLTKVRMASINHYANEAPPAAFDATKVQVGARQFSERGCVYCHGAPGVNWAKFSEGLRPDAPDLKEVVNDRTPSQLFWVIKNGINMTGMPSFAIAGASDDDIWSIVAFLEKLPNVSEVDYKSWTTTPPANQ